MEGVAAVEAVGAVEAAVDTVQAEAEAEKRGVVAALEAAVQARIEATAVAAKGQEEVDTKGKAEEDTAKRERSMAEVVDMEASREDQ